MGDTLKGGDIVWTVWGHTEVHKRTGKD